MSKVVLITYANKKYADQQKAIADFVDNHTMNNNMVFDEVISYTPSDMDPEFVAENKEILSSPRGAGYWLWKPYFILKTLKKLQPNDIVLYMDSGDQFIKESFDRLRESVLATMKNQNILLTKGGFPNRDWTKRDCFVLMGCDSDIYHNAIQVEAGIILATTSWFTITFISEWLSLCKNKELITDSPNAQGENFASFVDHRHDQSILSLLAIKKDIATSAFMREYINCNAQ